MLKSPSKGLGIVIGFTLEGFPKAWFDFDGLEEEHTLKEDCDVVYVLYESLTEREQYLADSLALEFCSKAMSKDRMDKWKACQVVSSAVYCKLASDESNPS